MSGIFSFVGSAFWSAQEYKLWSGFVVNGVNEYSLLHTVTALLKQGIFSRA